ncbi:hypothetical protein EDD18DRAFT_1069168 [Armillaria luteobubalina]|uniref:Heterokaryon incompatibility domain-containing protein n=1 Tax=Armillaria luteobubalina TaxID=153913 RepID=A0AA39UR79_9AGAR|nr:hypothetical protein EDD18DRAFT_1069168 [Armillaria luteobubalina]
MVPVIKQRSYTGEKAIQSALADILCVDLGVKRVVDELNNIFDTSYTLDSVTSILNPYISQNDDFGTAYAFLRPHWSHIAPLEKTPTLDPYITQIIDFGTVYTYLRSLRNRIHRNRIAALEEALRTREEKDREMRRNVLLNGRLTRRDVPPRRLWDLRANRVVPYWVARSHLWAISHAWVDEKDRVDVMTPINGCEWPVPMPKDADLNLIRIEMLNLGAQYVWLDVLCLRQEGGKNEHLRLDEWKLDVPTIGAVYEQGVVYESSRVVYYFNGLGRPLDLTPGYFESDRCWFRRAWTLQEITERPIIAGVTSKDVMDTQVQTRFDEELNSFQRMRESPSIFDLLSGMRNRVSTKPLDKVSGLVYLLRQHVIPIYDPMQSPEEAWQVLMDVMRYEYQTQLFFFYPEPGHGKKCWRPSWQQVMSDGIVVPPIPLGGVVERTADPDIYSYTGYHIRSANVRGLSEVPDEPTPRLGETDIRDDNGEPRTLKIIADHMYSIPDSVYTLLGCDDRDTGPDRWVVGKIREDKRFEKLSVFRSADDEVHANSLELYQLFKQILC